MFCWNITLLCCTAVLNSVIINNACGDIHGAEKLRFILRRSARSQNLLQDLYFHGAKYKTKLQKKERDSDLSSMHTEKEKKIYLMEKRMHATPRLQIQKHEDTEVLQHSAIFIQPCCTHTRILHYSLTTGLFICYFKIVLVLSWKTLLCHRLFLCISSATDLRGRETLQVFAGRAGMLACCPCCQANHNSCQSCVCWFLTIVTSWRCLNISPPYRKKGSLLLEAHKAYNGTACFQISSPFQNTGCAF